MSDFSRDPSRLGLAASPERLSDLRRRIGIMCHAVRIASLAYAGWLFVQIIVYWLDGEAVRRGWSALLRIRLEPLETWQLVLGCAVHLAIWSATAAACLCAWKVFSLYLKGQIFTVDASRWLGRVGYLGLAAQVADIVTRPLIALIVSAHMPAGQRGIGFMLHPQDLLILLFLTALIALAHIYRAAAEIAHDHAQIV